MNKIKRFKEFFINENIKTNDSILDEFLNELNNIHPLQPSGLSRNEFIYDEKALLIFNRFDKRDRNEIELQNISVFDKGERIGSSVMKDITDIADKLSITLTLEAKPFGRHIDGLDKENLINFYKKNGFETDMSSFGGDFETEEEMVDYVISENTEGLSMIRKPKN